jgi:hypothetical protein
VQRLHHKRARSLCFHSLLVYLKVCACVCACVQPFLAFFPAFFFLVPFELQATVTVSVESTSRFNDLLTPTTLSLFPTHTHTIVVGWLYAHSLSRFLSYVVFFIFSTSLCFSSMRRRRLTSVSPLAATTKLLREVWMGSSGPRTTTLVRFLLSDPVHRTEAQTSIQAS